MHCHPLFFVILIRREESPLRLPYVKLRATLEGSFTAIQDDMGLRLYCLGARSTSLRQRYFASRNTSLISAIHW